MDESGSAFGGGGLAAGDDGAGGLGRLRGAVRSAGRPCDGRASGDGEELLLSGRGMGGRWMRGFISRVPLAEGWGVLARAGCRMPEDRSSGRRGDAGQLLGLGWRP